MEFLALLTIVGIPVGVWFAVAPAHFKRSFGITKPAPPLPFVQGEAISTEVVRVHDHSRTGPAPEDIGQIHEPLAPPVPPKPLKHQIIRHEYHKAYDGSLWPKWICKCGGSAYVPVGVYNSLEKAQREAREEGDSHVVNGNKAEEMLDKSKGAFAW